MAKSQSPISLVSTVRGAVGGAGLVALASTLTDAVKVNPYTLGGGAVGGAIIDNGASWLFNKPAQPSVGERMLNGLTTAGQVAVATTAVITGVGTVLTMGAQAYQLIQAIRAGRTVETQEQAQERAAG